MLFRQLHGQKWAYSRRAHCQQQRHMMRLDCLRGFHHQRHTEISCVHHGPPCCRSCQQHGYRGTLRVHTAIAQNYQSAAHAARAYFTSNSFYDLPCARNTLLRRKRDINFSAWSEALLQK